jgi:hypothetical protein
MYKLAQWRHQPLVALIDAGNATAKQRPDHRLQSSCVRLCLHLPALNVQLAEHEQLLLRPVNYFGLYTVAACGCDEHQAPHANASTLASPLPT